MSLPIRNSNQNDEIPLRGRFCAIDGNGSPNSAISPFISTLRKMGWRSVSQASCLRHGKFCKEDVDLVLSVDDAKVHGKLGEGVWFNHFMNHQAITNKANLVRSLNNGDRYGKAVSPKTFVLDSEDDLNSFMAEFHISAAWSVLKKTTPISSSKNDLLVGFALSQCRRHLGVIQQLSSRNDHRCGGQNDAFARNEQDPRDWLTSRWRDLVLLNESSDNVETSSDLYEQVQRTLASLHENKLPALRAIGNYNLWIVKPSDRSRGIGISVHRKLSDILAKVKRSTGVRVVQKYVECPLLTDNGRKFDIRLWALITSWEPLELWLYDECYGRCSSAKYDATSTNRKVHLCNYAMQRSTGIHASSSPEISEKQSWLISKQSISEEIWKRGIAPERVWAEVEQACAHAFRSGQCQVVHRPNTFELYGVDILLDDTLHPWLMEVNLSPGLSHHGQATHGQMVTGMIESLFQAVLRSSNVTSGWKRIQVGSSPPSSPTCGIRFLLQGRHLTRAAYRRHERILNQHRALQRLKSFAKWIPFQWRCIKRRKNLKAVLLQSAARSFVQRLRSCRSAKRRFVHSWFSAFRDSVVHCHWNSIAMHIARRSVFQTFEKIITAAVRMESIARMAVQHRHFSTVLNSVSRLQRWLRRCHSREKLKQNLMKMMERKEARRRIQLRRIIRSSAATNLQAWWTRTRRVAAAKLIQRRWKSLLLGHRRSELIRSISKLEQFQLRRLLRCALEKWIRVDLLTERAERWITRLMYRQLHANCMQTAMQEMLRERTQACLTEHAKEATSIREPITISSEKCHVSAHRRYKYPRPVKRKPQTRKPPPVPWIWQRASRPCLPTAIVSAPS